MGGCPEENQGAVPKRRKVKAGKKKTVALHIRERGGVYERKCLGDEEHEEGQDLPAWDTRGLSERLLNEELTWPEVGRACVRGARALAFLLLTQETSREEAGTVCCGFSRM